jgi:hypothetical protein
MHNQASNVSLADALDAAEEANTDTAVRGDSRVIIRVEGQKYSCAGNQPRSNANCIQPIHRALKMAPPQYQCQILKHIWQMKHLFNMHIDTNQTQLVKPALELVSANISAIPQANVKDGQHNRSSYYGAFSCGVNVYL